MRLSINVKNFVFTSSIAVYGAGQTPMTEEMIPVPEDRTALPSSPARAGTEGVSHEMFGLDYVDFPAPQRVW